MLTVVLAFALLALAGWIVELGWRAYDFERYSGESFAVVEGARIRIAMDGPANARPAVVFLSGLFDVAPDWHWVQTALSATTRTFSYDRPGTGFSDAIPGTSDGKSQARWLHDILRSSGLTPPYVLVGHSIGGSYAIVYANMYPAEVKGLVLLEPLHPDEWERQPTQVTDADKQFHARTRLLRWLAPFAVGRWLKPFQSFGEGLPEAILTETKALNSSAHHLQGVTAEIDALEKTKEQQRAVKSLGDLPIAILSAGMPSGDATAAYHRMHREMRSLSVNATWEVFADGNHSSIVHDQKGSLRSVALIQEVWEKAPRGP